MINISALGMINALGDNLIEISNQLSISTQDTLQLKSNWLVPEKKVWLGAVKSTLPEIPTHLSSYNSRNNRLLLAAQQQIDDDIKQVIAKFGQHRIAVIIGTSTSGIDEGDRAIQSYIQDKKIPKNYAYHQQELGDPAIFLSSLLGTTGPTYTISTACTSSARAIISGKRLIEANLADVAIVGGADSFSRMPINGFNSLEAISPEPCTPFAKNRKGINIGEGSALFLLTRNESLNDKNSINLLGCGESSDAYHISAPHPIGIGAEKAMKMALTESKLIPQDLGYINLHGTGTLLNDSAESQATYRMLTNEGITANVPCSSTKHLTGHTLGCAAATELGISYLILRNNLYLPPQNFSNSTYDPSLPPLNMVTHTKESLQKRVIMSNSFAFGGNNTSIIIGNLNSMS
ncbi:beta-ketoacyl-[acyl-carrier-protein] synthase family protein [Orbaceae bacterium ESL0721]|nr:beta-ketoacyl-[acyl-carrier-protein] synthase family protein [Orbaceae bacterium ESL0721]